LPEGLQRGGTQEGVNASGSEDKPKGRETTRPSCLGNFLEGHRIGQPSSQGCEGSSYGIINGGNAAGGLLGRGKFGEQWPHMSENQDGVCKSEESRCRWEVCKNDVRLRTSRRTRKEIGTTSDKRGKGRSNVNESRWNKEIEKIIWRWNESEKPRGGSA